MSAIRSVPLLSVILGLILCGCRDERHEAAHGWLQANPPAGFAVVSVPDDFSIANTGDGDGETGVNMHYRLLEPTVEVHDLFTLPQTVEISNQLATLRGWALASLPAGDPTREAILSQISAVRAPFPVKRAVSPKGTEIESLVMVTIHKTANGWQVSSSTPAPSAPGSPDQDPNIPFEDSATVTAKLASLRTGVQSVATTRQKYLDDRRRAGDRSLAALRPKLQTGNVFEGVLPDHTPVRLIVSRGADAERAIVAVLSVEGGLLSSARYIGGISQTPSGEAFWRAAQVTSLSSQGINPATDDRLHPILTLKTKGKGLSAEIQVSSGTPLDFDLVPVGAEDLIPESSLQDTGHQ